MIVLKNCVENEMYSVMVALSCVIHWSDLDYFRPDHDLKIFVLNCYLSTLC